MRSLCTNLLLLAMLAVSQAVTAQSTMPESLHLYEKGSTRPGILQLDYVNLIDFTDEDKYLACYMDQPIVNGSGDFAITFSVGWGLTIKKLLAKVIPEIDIPHESTDQSEILKTFEQQYLAGTLTGLHEVNGRDTIAVEPGSWQVLVVGLDDEGNYANCALSEPCTLPIDLSVNLLTYQTAGDIFDNYDVHYKWGYGSILRIREIMGEDACEINTNYSHYTRWIQNEFQGPDFVFAHFLNQYFHLSIFEINKAIGMCQRRARKSDDLNAMLGKALAMRAFCYLDWARMCEFLPNDATSPINEAGNDVTGLTVPILPETMQYWNEQIMAPRATHQDMLSYILSDLNRAESIAKEHHEARADKRLPDLLTIYGLMARAYLWDGNYAKASEYSQKVINAKAYTCLTPEDIRYTYRGFNDSQAPSWMFSMNYKQDCSAVTSGLCNWVSWCSNQSTFGYTGEATNLYYLINRSLYDRIGQDDIRRSLFYGTYVTGDKIAFNADQLYEMPAYAALKFHPKDADDHIIGASVDVPLMRMEEMEFINIECVARNGMPGVACQLLNKFMQTYRDPGYDYTFTTLDALIEEIFLQKRIEFWGEGISFFDYKRLNHPVTRGYEGTNYQEKSRFNTTTRPAWMNIVLTNTHVKYNQALEGWNNPDPSDCYIPWYND